jgi:hypothetical protein
MTTTDTAPVRRLTKLRVLAAIALGLALTGAAVAAPAQAQTAPELACGSTVPDHCADTAHFDQVDEWDTPIGTDSATCPAYITADFLHLVATGNGIEHVNINKADDFWATTTFTGTATMTLYDPANVQATIDDQGNVVAATVTGPPDATITGRFTEWFGVSDNKQNATFGITMSVNGVDQDGHPIDVHGTSHTTWTPGSEPFVDAPHHAKLAVHC